MATHSSVLAWRIPGTGKPGGLLSMGSHRVGHDGSNLAAAAAAWGTTTSDFYSLISHVLITVQLQTMHLRSSWGQPSWLHLSSLMREGNLSHKPSSWHLLLPPLSAPPASRVGGNSCIPPGAGSCVVTNRHGVLWVRKTWVTRYWVSNKWCLPGKKKSNTKEIIILVLWELETMQIWTKEMGNLPNEHDPLSPWSTLSAPGQAKCPCIGMC